MKGWKKHPITGEIVPAHTKVPPAKIQQLVETIDYTELTKEYYDGIKAGILVNIHTFLDSKGFSNAQKNYYVNGFIKEKHPDFWKKVLELTREHYHSNSVQIDTALVNQCLKGDPRAIKLYYERIEGWINQADRNLTAIQIILPQFLGGKTVDIQGKDVDTNEQKDKIDE